MYEMCYVNKAYLNWLGGDKSVAKGIWVPNPESTGFDPPGFPQTCMNTWLRCVVLLHNDIA